MKNERKQETEKPEKIEIDIPNIRNTPEPKEMSSEQIEEFVRTFPDYLQDQVRNLLTTFQKPNSED